ncbi:MAG: DNA/RNA non-specific endonuclease [Streptococcaceae bacterium]|jgi:DNA-entry nuclease|nr:DNA/RNA non-specific endonuclease [Streptococcaceae bacterium]
MKKSVLLLIAFLGLLTFSACTSGAPTSSSSSSSDSSSTSAVSSSQNASSTPSSSQSSAVSADRILQKLITLTNARSAGDNKNYYWENGKARLTGFEALKAGSFLFQQDAQGRSGVARAILTYSEFEASKGARQGTPLNPPHWPKNKMTTIHFALTGKSYHGYLYNRSHSIADSLLGSKSYTSAYNFTTGTRSQNVGANQNGGMRAAEELAENYWKSNPNSNATISYETTPLYSGSETIPRGSIVDEKSSDGALNSEIVVINDAEGISIDYTAGTFH